MGKARRELSWGGLRREKRKKDGGESGIGSSRRSDTLQFVP
jgi:hypothetical protein